DIPGPVDVESDVISSSQIQQSLSPQKVDLDLKINPVSGTEQFAVSDSDKLVAPIAPVAITPLAVEGPSSSAEPPTDAVKASAPQGANSPPQRPWASLLKDPLQLEEIGTPSQHDSGVPFVFIPDENIQAAKEEFKDFLFARFHGDTPSMGRIIGVVNAIWARNGPRIIVHNIGAETFLLRVTVLRTRELILSRNLWTIAGFPMFVAPWSPDFNPEEPPLSSAVVPVEFRDVPYLLFNKESLGRIATAIGTPVALAPETERKQTFEVAKVYVRVNLLKELPTRVVSGFSSGREVLITVSYPWLPVKCQSCGLFGHESMKCTSQLQHHPSGRRKCTRSPSLEPKRKKRSRPGQSRARRAKSNRLSGIYSPLEEGEIDQSHEHPIQVRIKGSSSSHRVSNMENSETSASVGGLRRRHASAMIYVPK
ncbi:hypothetical protein EUTSA_v10017665mg, partial [Eutrema salsugineum]